MYRKIGCWTIVIICIVLSFISLVVFNNPWKLVWQSAVIWFILAYMESQIENFLFRRQATKVEADVVDYTMVDDQRYPIYAFSDVNRGYIQVTSSKSSSAALGGKVVIFYCDENPEKIVHAFHWGDAIGILCCICVFWMLIPWDLL